MRVKEKREGGDGGGERLEGGKRKKEGCMKGCKEAIGLIEEESKKEEEGSKQRNYEER
jgi:hypothetical protein